MYIYIYINTYVYFFSFPPFISRFLFSTVSAPIYDLNCSTLQTARSLQPQKHARCVWPRCGALLSLSPRHRERRLVVPELNVLFIASWKTRKFSSLLTPSFISHRSNHAKDSTVLSFPSHLFFLFPNPWTWKKKRKSLPNRFLPSFFLNFSWRKFPYFQFKLVFFWSHRFNSDRFFI